MVEKISKLYHSKVVPPSFKGISTPMGVVTYNNIRIKDALPSQEQLAERVRLLQNELKEAKRLTNKADNTEKS